MAKITSDHIPCKIIISTNIPRANLFRFENFWVEQDDFLDTVLDCWNITPTLNDAARNISSKFKALRASLKHWSKHLSNLGLLISNCNQVICFIDALEDRRELYNPEANLRCAVKRQLQKWLRYKNLYWKKHFTVNRIKLGDECTKFFHDMTTISYRKNAIS